MRKPTLDYRAKETAETESGGFGFVALVCSFSAIGLDVVLLMGWLCRNWLELFLDEKTLKMMVGAGAILSGAAILLSFVFGSAAWFERGRARELGVSAMILSGGWLLVAGLVFRGIPV